MLVDHPGSFAVNGEAAGPFLPTFVTAALVALTPAK
jgi:hypothetical protein